MSSKDAVFPLGDSFEKLEPGGRQDSAPTIGPEIPKIKRRESQRKKRLLVTAETQKVETIDLR